jgi:hypothetical protein
MATNSFITPQWELKDVARVLVNTLKFAANVDRYLGDKFSVAGSKVGYAIDVRLPQRFRTVKGQAFVAQPINDLTVRVSITDQAQIGTAVSTADATMIVEDVRKRYVFPASEQLANTLDYDGLFRCYSGVSNSVGTAGTVPNQNLTYALAGAKLSDGAIPDDGRIGMLSPTMSATIANANVSFYNPTAAISEGWRKGRQAGPWMGIDEVYATQNLAKHITGGWVGTLNPTVTGAGQTGSTLVTGGFSSGSTSFNKGDVFTIVGVYKVNPQNYASTGTLQDFVVTANVADSAGAVTMTIDPPIITSGPLQTVTNSPAANAALVFQGSVFVPATPGYTMSVGTTSTQGLVYHPEAFILAMADLDNDLPGADVTQVSSKSLAVSLRYVKQYSGQTDQKIERIDALYGWTVFRPEMAVRVWS